MTPWATGTQVGPYVLLSLLGIGGMGEVWKARDDRLGRIVAIKRLTRHGAARFEQEARAIAALNHPHICQIYDVGPDYLVMEYIDGTRLQGPVPAAEAARLATQIASALGEAHDKHILHRDLKPGNIVVTSKGVAKLLDFGLARLMNDGDATRSIAVSGTPHYMSPEQVEGHALDARSDIFSFGAVLYELVSGRRAFDSMAAVLRDAPAPLDGPLAPVVMQCLAKQPSARFQTVAEITAALHRTAAPSSTTAGPSIAVLAFDDMSASKDQEWFGDGLAEEIINALAQIPALKVIARTSAFAFKGRHKDVRKIAGALGVTHVLEGSVRQSGDRVRITAQLITAADGSHLWSERYDRQMADVFEIQDEIARTIVKSLAVKLSPKAARGYTPSVAAYEALLRGRFFNALLTAESLVRAREYFQQAAALDPGWALPHLSLVSCWYSLTVLGLKSVQEIEPSCRAEVQAVLDLDALLPEAHFGRGFIAALFDYDWAEAERHFRLAMTDDSLPLTARSGYVIIELLARRPEEALALMQRAADADPLNVGIRHGKALCLLATGNTAEAAAEERAALELNARFHPSLVGLAMTYETEDRVADALVLAEQAHELAPFDPIARGFLAGLLMRQGDARRAHELLNEIPAFNQALARFIFACVSRDDEQAALWAERAVAARAPHIRTFVCQPFAAALRAGPRWPALAKMMNL